jgi:O-antigen/teichoic acid export membrane protein
LTALTVPSSAAIRSLAAKARRIGAAFASNAAGTVLGQIVQLVAIPLQLHYLGTAQFGLIVLFNSLVAAGSLTDAGIGPTVLRFVARTQRHPKALEHVIASSLTVIVMISALLAVAVLAGTQAWIGWHGVTPVAGTVHPLALAGLVAAAVSTSMVSWLGLNMLRGLRQYRVFALCESIQRVVLPLLCTLVAVITRDAAWVLFALCIWTALAAAVTLRYAARRARVRLHLTSNLRYFRRRMFSFGRWVWAQSVFAYAGSQADRLVVAGAMGLSALGIYAVAVSAANAFLAVLTAGGAFLLPEAASRLADRAWLTRAFVRYTLMFSAVSALGIVAFTPLAKPVLDLWVGAPIAVQVLPVLLPLLWTISSAAASAPGSHILNAMGHSRFLAAAGAIANTLVLLLMVAGGALFGLWGVIGAKLFAVPFGFCIRAVTSARIFGLPHPIRTAFKTMWPTLIGALIVLPLSWHWLVAT